MYDLYTFYNNTETYYLTNNNTAVVVGDNTYDPIPIERTEVVYEESTKNLELTMFADEAPLIGRLWRTLTPSPVWVLVKTVVGESTYTIFLGQIISATFDSRLKVKATVVSIESIMQSKAPTVLYQPTCRWELYGTGCGKNRALYITSLIYGVDDLSISDNVFTSAYYLLSREANYYTFGYVEITHGAFVERQMIVKNEVVGDNVVITMLNAPYMSIVSGTVVDFYAGCDLLITTCDTKFSNSAKFGGFPYVPYRNPFLGVL